MFMFQEIKYQLFRSGKRTVLAACISAALFSCMVGYLGNIEAGRQTLNNLGSALPVTVTISNRNGQHLKYLEIDKLHFDGIMELGVDDPVYTSRAYVVREGEEFLPEIGRLGEYLQAANTAKAFEQLEEDTVAFAEGWDLSYFEDKKPVCLLRESVLRKLGAAINKELALELYAPKYASDGLTVLFTQIGKSTLTVIGTYPDSVSSVEGNILVSTGWLKQTMETAGVDYYCDSFYGVVKDPLMLNTFKEQLRKKKFGMVSPEGRNGYWGDAAIFDDRFFIENAEKLQGNLAVLERFLIPFFILVLLLVVLVTFLILRNERQSIAIATALGRPKVNYGCSFFCSTLLANLLGVAVVAVPVLLFVGISFFQLIGILALFILCISAGTLAALAMVFRFNPLDLLTKLD